MTNITAIIFDFGNVLLEWDPRFVYRRYFPNDEKGMEDFLEEIKFMEWNAQQDKGRPFEEGIAILSREFPHRATLIQAYHDHWQDSIGSEIAGSVKILTRLKAKGYPLYGLSNWSPETFPYALTKYDFFELFDDKVVSGYVGLVKPDPAIFTLALDTIGKPAQDCLFIDDSAKNIEQAKRMGFVTIHFTSPERLENELKEMELL
ncbi:MAG: HAD family phosphatase [Anaerolineales bacterium]|nr:HAD family phosphatase [Anaerolineales bacterium]